MLLGPPANGLNAAPLPRVLDRPRHAAAVLRALPGRPLDQPPETAAANGPALAAAPVTDRARLRCRETIVVLDSHLRVLYSVSFLTDRL